ncbi:GntR family transcriptional regulator [Stenomitos frigidus]|uniref:GntR family transcriptional regulator n=1 Tax=Stenomitos frigidus ULC18 TaxID=2107698 RepID=A0A2T1DSP6_9CYAN|nr:GntR family transcriptional regulator [Stenomitos frigidus]PSB23523.1 GntR family transcriptional regulator [Stenomitos frigidus ULC18]
MTRLVIAQAKSPLHSLISEKLREQIASGIYAAGEQLPSEHQLMEQFGVSRITVRRAIANLVNQGLVTAHRGKGVFVNEQRKVVYSLSNPLVFFDEDMARQGVTLSIRNLVFEPQQAPESVQHCLQLSHEQRDVYLQKKCLLIDQVPIMIDTTYILADLGAAYAADLQTRMTFPTLEQNGVAIVRIEATLESTHADHELSAHLEIPLGSPLMVYRYTAYTHQEKPILCGEALSRGDRLSYSVVLTKPIDS